MDILSHVLNFDVLSPLLKLKFIPDIYICFQQNVIYKSVVLKNRVRLDSRPRRLKFAKIESRLIFVVVTRYRTERTYSIYIHVYMFVLL